MGAVIISRRHFLGFAAAGALLVPELLLPRKTFFLPPAGGWYCRSSDEWINSLPQLVCNAEYTFRVIGGTLPPGMKLSADGVLSGNPRVAGMHIFRIEGEFKPRMTV